MTYDKSSTSIVTIPEWKDLDDPTPIWFMDVDGVINALGYQDVGYESGSASPYLLSDFLSGDMARRRRTSYDRDDDMPDDEWLQIATDDHAHSRYSIQWNASLTARILRMHQSGRVRVVWTTTWGTGANYELGPLIGWPELEVIADPPAREAQLGTLNNEWWKFYWVRKYVEASSATKFIWTDDDLRLYANARTWAEDAGNVCAIASNWSTGLTYRDLKRIDEFLS